MRGDRALKFKHGQNYDDHPQARQSAHDFNQEWDMRITYRRINPIFDKPIKKVYQDRLDQAEVAYWHIYYSQFGTPRQLRAERQIERLRLIIQGHRDYLLPIPNPPGICLTCSGEGDVSPFIPEYAKGFFAPRWQDYQTCPDCKGTGQAPHYHKKEQL